jgi:hypothetical protein
VIVEMEPPCECLGARVLGSVDAHVGPFVDQGAVEAFDLSVPLRSTGREAPVARSGRRHGRAEGGALVAGAVVGLDDLDADALAGEPGSGAFPEADGTEGLFVVEDFAVGDAAVAVDGGVDERVADPRRGVVGDVAASMDAPAAARWENRSKSTSRSWACGSGAAPSTRRSRRRGVWVGQVEAGSSGPPAQRRPHAASVPTTYRRSGGRCRARGRRARSDDQSGCVQSASVDHARSAQRYGAVGVP